MSTPEQQTLASLGVTLDAGNDTQLIGDCPFCGKANHFHVRKGEPALLWDCKKCQRSGDRAALLSEYFNESLRPAFRSPRQRALADFIGCPVPALRDFAIGWSEYKRAFAFLVTDPSGRAVDIRFRRLKGKTLSTTGCSAGLWGAADLATSKDATVYVVEGESDRIRLSAKLAALKRRAVVVSVPGAGVFKPQFADWLTGRDVVLLYDNDRAGEHGEQRAFARLAGRASSVLCLHWPKSADDGCDVRDWLNSGGKLKQLERHLRPQPRLGLPAQPATDTTLPASLLANYVFVVESKRFVDLGTLQRYDREQFDALHAPALNLRARGWPASIRFLNSSEAKRVERYTYRPHAPQVLEEGGLQALNLYRPSPLVPAAGDVTPWLDHAAYLLPDEEAREIVLSWMAFLVQNLAVKMNWALFLGGSQGIGKDALFAPLHDAIGRHNHSIVSPEDLASGYTDYLANKKLVTVQEFAVFDKKALMNRLKSFIAAPPDWLRVNEKFQPQYTIPNVASFVFFSNYKNALLLDHDDRRFFVYWSPVAPKPRDYYVALYEWLRQHSAAVFHYLLSRDVSQFNATGHAPASRDKDEVIKDSQSPLEQHLRARFEESARPFMGDLVTVTEIEKYVNNETHLRGVSLRAIAQVLPRLGATELRKQLRIPKGDKVWRPRVYAVRRPELYQHLSEAALTKAYGAQPTLTRFAKQMRERS